MVGIPKDAKIEKLEAKYLLMAHPFPALEGEMLLLQPKKEDQNADDKKNRFLQRLLAAQASP